jgi:peptide/nickel transport system permease protein
VSARTDPIASLLASPLFRWGSALLAILTVMSVGAPLLAPYPPYEQVDPAAARHLPPGSRKQAVLLRDGRWLLADEVQVTAEALIIERLGTTQTIRTEDVVNRTADGVADQRFFLLGSDRYGRDLWSRIVWGARVSLSIGLLAAALALTLGVAIGGLAALAGGWVDSVLMRLVDGLLMFPHLFLILAVAAFLDPGVLTVVLVLGATSWMPASRLVRSEILSLRHRDFVVAARSVGQRPLRIFWRHLLPSAIPPVLVDTSLRVGDLILVEAALSFLGLGVQPPMPSWGNLVADGSDALTSAWWVAAFPGLAIWATVMAFNLLGDGLRDRLDPRGAKPK